MTTPSLTNDRAMPTPLLWFDHDMPASESIDIAAHDYAAVPRGWQSLWRQTMRQLVNVRTRDRGFALSYLSVDWDDGLLKLDMPDADGVLAGIARRCSERSKFICRECGRRGRLRRFGMHEAAVLCPRCAAPQLLHRAIDETSKYPGLIAIGGRVDGLRRVPDVLRKSFMRAARSSGKEVGHEPSMDAVEFKKWVAQLNRVKALLPPCLPDHDGRDGR